MWNKKDRCLYIPRLGDVRPYISKETAVVFLTAGVLVPMVAIGLKPKILTWTLAASVRHSWLFSPVFYLLFVLVLMEGRIL